MIFLPASRPDLVKALIRRSRGYRPAATPEQAVELFQKAVTARDYETAALYCTGDYAVLMARGAPNARNLARSIDRLRTHMKARNIESEKAELALFWFDPFPVSFTAAPPQEDAEGRVWTSFSWEADQTRFEKIQPQIELWRLNSPLQNALLPIRLLPVIFKFPVEVRQNEDETWQLVMPVAGENRHMRETVSSLVTREAPLQESLDSLAEEMRGNRHTQQAFETELKTRLVRTQ
jgi:hypothetical protein